LIKPEAFLEELNAAGVEFFAGVPDSLLKEFLTLLQASVSGDKHHITASEGAAVALASGYHLATGKTPLVYMQNSGLGNAVNPLMSLSHCLVYGLPLVLLIGHRGAPNFKDEPQHSAMGAATLAILDNLAVPYQLLNGDEKDLKAFVQAAVTQANTISAPVAIVVAAGSFEKAQNVKVSSVESPETETKASKIKVEATKSDDLRAPIGLNREQVISALLAKLKGDEAIVASTGFNGRQLYECRLAAKQNGSGDFLNVGAMGHALPIAVGIALGKPEPAVICIDGDGALLMHLGSLISAGKSGAAVRHLLINNGAHESVGGQPTGAEQIGFNTIAKLAGYKYSHKLASDQSLDEALEIFLTASTPAFLEVAVDLGVKDNLARPSSDFQGSKREFMRFLKGHESG
jgi:phosphonopyruvate decarboxylase